MKFPMIPVTKLLSHDFQKTKAEKLMRELPDGLMRQICTIIVKARIQFFPPFSSFDGCE